MRKLGPLVALTLLALLGATPSAIAAWSTPANVNATYYPSTTNPRPIFDKSGKGATLIDGSSGFVIRSADNGLTWPGVPLGLVNTDYKFATYGAGERIWAWPAGGGNLKVARSGPAIVPTLATSASTLSASVGASAFAIVANASGDALIAWTSLGSRSATAAFWKAGESAPRTPQVFPIPTGSGGDSGATPTAFLDPDGAAAVVWTRGTDTGSAASQVSTANADTTPFSAPTTLLDGGSVIFGGGGQADDGRAIVLIREEKAISPNTYGVSVAITLKYATRSPGGAFGPPVLLDGDDDHVAVEPTLSVGATGATAIGWRNTANWTGDHSCEDLNLVSKSKAAVGVLTSGGISLASKTLSGAAHFGYAPKVAAGTDGRSGVVWEERTECGPPVVRERGFEYTSDGSGLGTADAPPYLPSAVSFNRCGQLLAFGIPSAAGSKFSSSTYDALPALDCSGSDPGGPTGGGGTPDPGGVGTPSPPAPVSMTVGKAKAKKGGSATVSAEFGGVGAVAAAVLFKKKSVVTVNKPITAAGPAKFTFKLKGKALKELKKKKKLKLQAKFTFTPANGAAPSTKTTSITFIK